MAAIVDNCAGEYPAIVGNSSENSVMAVNAKAAEDDNVMAQEAKPHSKACIKAGGCEPALRGMHDVCSAS